jgi:hypothetical protein
MYAGRINHIHSLLLWRSLRASSMLINQTYIPPPTHLSSQEFSRITQITDNQNKNLKDDSN